MPPESRVREPLQGNEIGNDKTNHTRPGVSQRKMHVPPAAPVVSSLTNPGYAFYRQMTLPYKVNKKATRVNRIFGISLQLDSTI